MYDFEDPGDREATAQEVERWRKTQEKKQRLVVGTTYRQISDEYWDELECLLNRVADSTEQDDDAFGLVPTGSATRALQMLKKLGMERY